MTTLKELVKFNPLQSEAIKMFLSRSTFDDPGRLADFAAKPDYRKRRRVAGSAGDVQRAQAHRSRLVLLKREVEISKLHCGDQQVKSRKRFRARQREVFSQRNS